MRDRGAHLHADALLSRARGPTTMHPMVHCYAANMNMYAHAHRA